MSDSATTAVDPVEMELEYMTLDDDSMPVRKTERWFLHYTMRSQKRMQEKMNLSHEAIEEAQQKAERAAERGADAEHVAMQSMMDVLDDLDMTEMELQATLLWGAMLWYAKQRGIPLTVDDVLDKLDQGNVEYVTTRWAKCYLQFQTGKSLTDDEVDALLNDEGDEGEGDASGKD